MDILEDDLLEDPADAVEDLVDVDRHLAAIRRATNERDDILRVYESEIGRLTDQMDAIRAVYERRIAWHRAPVESWHRAHPQKRTLVLPHGTISLRIPTVPKAWVVDVDAVSEWARIAHPEILKAPNVTDVRKVIELVETGDGWKAVDSKTGEFVDGLTVEMPDVSWSCRVADGIAP